MDDGARCVDGARDGGVRGHRAPHMALHSLARPRPMGGIRASRCAAPVRGGEGTFSLGPVVGTLAEPIANVPGACEGLGRALCCTPACQWDLQP